MMIRRLRIKIIPRIPFILNDSNCLFLKSLKKLAIETNSKDNEIEINRVYDRFAPLIIRRPNDMLNTDGNILRSALIDLMNIDFDEFPMSF